MAKKETAKKQTKKPNNQIIKDYKNPTDTLLGKIIIWGLIVAMVGGIVLALILALVAVL